MQDPFESSWEMTQLFNATMIEAQIETINDKWDELDEISQTTFRWIYGDRVPK